MAFEGANVASNVNTTEMPTTMATMEVATSSNGDTNFAPNMNAMHIPNTTGTTNTMEVSTSSYADTRIMKEPSTMELSTSSDVDTKMMIDGSSSVAMLKVTDDERVESKECKSPSSMDTEAFEQVILGQSVVRVENYIQEENAGNSPLLQDDMFSLAELSVVENQQLDEATTICSADIVTSVLDHCYESQMPIDDADEKGHIGHDHDNKNENGLLLPLEVSDVANASIDDKDERECMHGNQVTFSKSQPEVVMVKEMEIPERIPCVKQAELEVNQQSKDKKSEEMEIPISGVAVSINEGTVNMDIDHPSQGPSEELMQSKNMPQESLSIKEDFDRQELSQNVIQLEKASENINLREAYDESHTEHIEYKDGEQLQEIPEEFELLKGRKVCKKFGRKEYVGEVIGYDPTTKWFKVLYEDGDEEELEKNELDSILLPLDGNLVVSRKRRLPTDDDGHEDTSRTGRKLIKLNMQATPRKEGKREPMGDEITGSNRLSSSTKKRKRSVVKSGSKSKSKSPKVSVSKTGKGKSQSTAAKKLIEKEKSEKKSQSTQSKQKPNNQMERSSSKKAMVVAQNQNQRVTRKLKYGSATKKTSTKANQKAKDKEVKTPQLSITEISAAASTSSRKRKAGTDVQEKASMLSGKRTRRETVNNVESPPSRKTESKRRMIPEDGTETHLQVEADNNDTNDDNIPLPSGNRHVRSDKGSVLIGRKVRKDFGGSLYGGEIVGYKMYYNVKYDDGDTEDLNWKELESILLPEEGDSSEPTDGIHNTENQVNPVKSKPKKKN